MYILLRKAPRIKNNALILVVVGLLAVSDVAYPLSRMFKHTAFTRITQNLPNEATKNFKTSAYFEGLYVASFNSAMWIFALKFWTLSKRLKAVFSGGNPNELRSFTRFLYFSGITISISLGVALAVSTQFYIKGVKATNVFYTLNTAYQFLSCFVMFDAFRRLNQTVKENTQFIVNFKVLFLYLTSSILLSVSCVMTLVSQFQKNYNRKTIAFEIYIIFVAILMLVMLYILNNLAEKIHREEQNEVNSNSTIPSSKELSEQYQDETSSESSFNSEIMPEDRK
jgi:hypothetical protein